MKLGVVFLVIIFISCSNNGELKKDNNEQITIGNGEENVLDIRGFNYSINMFSDSMRISITDDATYLNEILLTQKMELSLQRQLPQIYQSNSRIETILNMPNRREPVINHVIQSNQFYQQIVLKSQNESYKKFLSTLIKRINIQGSFNELDKISSMLQMAILKDDISDNFFGINYLDFMYERLTEEDNKFNYNKFFEIIDSIFEQMNKNQEQENREMIKFLKDQLPIKSKSTFT